MGGEGGGVRLYSDFFSDRTKCAYTFGGGGGDYYRNFAVACFGQTWVLSTLKMSNKIVKISCLQW